MIGQTIGAYKVTAKIGEGGMGAVFRAEHTVLGRSAAIKVLLPEFSDNKQVVQRFFNEAKATTAIKHPGIVEIFDFGHHTDGSAFIVMELLQGEPLSHRLHRDKHLPHQLAVAIISQVAAALGAAHAKGIIHRDLKPDNIFLLPDPLVVLGIRVKLLDFGIAKLSQDLRGELEATRAGAVLGTPPYMAPEQCVGSTDVDHRSDMYALGCLLFHCLCGRPPFVAQEFARISIEHLTQAPPKPRSLESSVPEHLEHITLRLLEKKPDDRFQSCGQLVAAFEGRTERAATPVPAPGAAFAATPQERTKIETGSGVAAAPATSRKKTALLGQRLPESKPTGPTPPRPAVTAPSRKKTALMGELIPALHGAPPPAAPPHAAPAPIAAEPSVPVVYPAAVPAPVAEQPSSPVELPPVEDMPEDDSMTFLLPLIVVGVVGIIGIIVLLAMS